jgi:hypothetical protein
LKVKLLISRRDAMFLVPVAPELGLFLEESIFGAYNKRFGYDHEELTMKSFKKQVGLLVLSWHLLLPQAS